MARNCLGGWICFLIERSHLLPAVSIIVFALWLGVSVHTGKHSWLARVGLIPLFLAFGWIGLVFAIRPLRLGGDLPGYGFLAILIAPTNPRAPPLAMLMFW